MKLLAIALAVLQTIPLAAAPSIQDQVNAIAIGGKLTVRLIDGTEYHGNLHSIEPQSFSIREVDLKRIVTVAYGDCARVQNNYGGKGFGGRRVDPRKSFIVGAVFLAALLTIVVVLVANDKS